jgi:hypothetical protein
LAYAQRRRRETGPLLRGRLILYRYSRHYRQARRRYLDPSGLAEVRSVYDVGVVAMRPGDPPRFRLPADFAGRVARVARGAAAALDRPANCDFFPAVPVDGLASHTGELAAVTRGEVISIKLRDPFAVEGLQDLSEPLLNELERTVYRSHVIVDKVYVYRSPVTQQAPAASWLWHFDNHPREMLKVMVYLTDVGADSAPFEYLADANGRPRLGAPLAPLHGDSRVPAREIDRCLAAGWTREVVTGPAGTVLVFDDNVVHRGTLARAGHRDVVVFQVRPVTFRATPRLDPRWTGSFGHRDFNENPDDLAPVPRAAKAAGPA